MAEDEPIPIGGPFQNTEILLLDEENRLAKEGEICILRNLGNAWIL